VLFEFLVGFYAAVKRHATDTSYAALVMSATRMKCCVIGKSGELEIAR
jgi:hypothetical protein